LAAFARDSALLRLIHRSKAAIGRAFMLVIPRHDVSFLDKVLAGDVAAYRYRMDNGPSGGTVPVPHCLFERRLGREPNFACKICRKTRRLGLCRLSGIHHCVFLRILKIAPGNLRLGEAFGSRNDRG
jgi:hypothetical protein